MICLLRDHLRRSSNAMHEANIDETLAVGIEHLALESERYVESSAVCFSGIFLIPSFRHIEEKYICMVEIVSLPDKIILRVVHKLWCDGVSPHL